MKNQLKTIALLGTLSAVLVAIGGSLGSGALTVSLLLALVMNVGAYFFSDRIVLRMSRAVEVGRAEEPALHALVEELSRSAGIPKPRVYIIPEAQPNAFATGRNPEHGVVAVTAGIRELLSERELRGVLAHELAHIKNRDILIQSIAATVAAAVSYVANFAQFAAVFGGGHEDDDEGSNPLYTLVLALVAPIAALFIQMGISRSREYHADQVGAEISKDPLALAMALEKLERGASLLPAQVTPATSSLYIVNPFARISGIMNLFSTHPSTEDRVARLQAMAAANRGVPRSYGQGALRSR